MTGKLGFSITKLMPVLIVPLILLAGFLLLSNASAMPRQTAHSYNATWDMRQFDFARHNAALSGYAEFIPEALLSPAEFEIRASEAIIGDARYATHATSRQTFLVSHDGWYTFARSSARYAHRVYVNGRLVTSVGLPGATADTNIPGYGRIVITAQAQNGIIEIVQQVSNFMGTRGSHHHTWLVGTGDDLINETRVVDSQNAMVMGAFLMMSLLLLLLYFILIKNRGMLFSSLFCMIWFIRLGAAGERTLAPFGDWIDGNVLFRMEYVTIPLAIITAIAIIPELFPNVLHKIFLRVLYVAGAALALFYSFADTYAVAFANSMLYPAYGAVFVVLIISFAVKVRNLTLEQWLFMGGVIIAGLSAGIYILQFAVPDTFPALAFDPAGVPMLLFLILMAMAVFVATMNETNATKLRREVAEASNEAKSKFLARMSHEIRTPISAVMGISEIQLKGTHHTPQVEEALTIINNSAHLLLGIVNDILDLSKIEAGKMEMVPVEYNISYLISSITHLQLSRIKDKNINFRIYVDENLPLTLIGDELRIAQIANNLLSNAFKYTEQGLVEFSIQCEQDDGKFVMVISISDTGPGMSKEQLDAMRNNEYMRFHEREYRTEEGTGLGMPIVYSLTKILNATLDISSELGKGTDVTVRIPQEPQGMETLGIENAVKLQNLESYVNSATKKELFAPEPMPYGRVLVVDDVDTNLYVARGLLAFYDLQTDTCESGIEAVKKVESGKTYDIIFMDHMMPVMDGIEAMQEIKKLGYTRPIVALTANALIGHAEKFMEQGFDDFLSKPLQTANLNTVLVRYIKSKYPPEVIAEANLKKARNIDNFQQDENIQQSLRLAFAKKQRNTFAEITAAIHAKDVKKALILAHSLKGSAGLIHEHTLALAAGKVEAQLADENIPTEDNLLSLEAELNTTLQAIIPASDGNEKNSEIIAMMDDLKPLLAQHNSESLKYIEKLRAIPEAAILAKNIEEFDFKVALVNIDTLRDVLA